MPVALTSLLLLVLNVMSIHILVQVSLFYILVIFTTALTLTNSCVKEIYSIRIFVVIAKWLTAILRKLNVSQMQ